ncbi:MAG TPA: DUF2892 domain-containing protein [Thermoanaerobaculia bacterium]|nr:DUF2892 domain-containing protein [Thermoanaerobaculia bacterium]
MTFMNLSAGERVIRVVLGLLMLAAGWSGWVPGVWAVALKAFGWVPLLTGLIGWCPFYALLGIRTAKL